MKIGVRSRRCILYWSCGDTRDAEIRRWRRILRTDGERLLEVEGRKGVEERRSVGVEREEEIVVRVKPKDGGGRGRSGCHFSWREEMEGKWRGGGRRKRGGRRRIRRDAGSIYRGIGGNLDFLVGGNTNKIFNEIGRAHV